MYYHGDNLSVRYYALVSHRGGLARAEGPAASSKEHIATFAVSLRLWIILTSVIRRKVGQDATKVFECCFRGMLTLTM